MGAQNVSVRHIRYLLLTLSVLLAPSVAGLAEAAPGRAIEYGGIRLGMSKAQAGKHRKLSCQPTRFEAAWCSVATKGEARFIVWLLKDRVVYVAVDWPDSMRKPHEQFIKPYVARLGPPDVADSSVIPMGPYAGGISSKTVWQHPDFVQILSRRRGDNAKSVGFSLMFMDNSKAEALENVQILWEQVGLEVPF